VTLKDEDKVEKGYQLSVVSFKDQRFVFASQEKASRFFLNPSRYHTVQLPVKMPAPKDPVLLHQLQKQEDCKTFMAQALGSVSTRALREVGENRLKYPTLTVKETMLKLFAIFLKAENPANTAYMREKYHAKMKLFIHRCEVPQELHKLSSDKQECLQKGDKWPQFKEDYYNELGKELDEILKAVPKEKQNSFCSYMK
jgi:adenylate/nucleoside-diphosphate kinase